MKIGVTFCSQSMFKMKGEEQQCITVRFPMLGWKSVKIPRRNKAKTGVLRSNKYLKRAHNRHHGVQRYFVLCNKVGMPERKYLLYSAEDFTGVRTKCPIKDGMGGSIWSRTNNVQLYKNYENKWKQELKALKKLNNKIYSIAKKSGSHCEIKNIKKIRENILRRLAFLTVMIWTLVRR